MSYDVYFWFRASGNIDDVLDALAEEELGHLEPHPSVRAFRHDLLRTFPALADVTSPAVGTDADMRYLGLTLPYGWTGYLPQVEQLAASRGLNGYDPQRGEHVGAAGDRSRRLGPLPLHDDTAGAWTLGRLEGLGVGVRALSKAWSAAGLSEEVAFGEAVGAFILAMAMRDGVDVDVAEARAAVAEVARLCVNGVPREGHMIQIGYCVTDVTGFAGKLARGDV